MNSGRALFEGGTQIPPPLMVRGGVERSETEGIRKPAFDSANLKRRKSIRKKGVTCYALFALTRRGVPSRKGRELCPMGTKREGKPRFSGATLRAHAVVSPFNFSAISRCIFSAKKCNETKM